MTASLVTYPHEVIRTRLQVDYAPGQLGAGGPPSARSSTPSLSSIQPHYPSSSTVPSPRPAIPITRVPPPHAHPLSLMAIIHTIRAVVNESGWRGMYRGLSINLLRTVPNSGITLLT